MSDDLLLLKKLVDQLLPLPDRAWQDFSSAWQPFSARRKEVLTQQGTREKYIYFITGGVQRVFYLDEQDREATLIFTFAPSFGGVLDSFLNQSPAKYTYETLTPSTFLRASYTQVEQLMKDHREIETMIRRGLSQTLAGLLERLVELQCFSSEEKFRKILHRSPHLLHLVPHKYIANYLGMDATNFSKLMNRVKI